MIILGDPRITEAVVSASNIGAAIFAEKLQTFDLSDNMRTISNSTVINIDFGASGRPVIDLLALCGTNLTSAAVVQLSYSDVDIESPDATITLPVFSDFIQVFTFISALQKRYWRISITDSTLTELWIGYIYIGKSLTIDTFFPHTPGKNIASNSAVNSTGQEYGSKRYTFHSADWIFVFEYDGLEEFLDMVDSRANIDRVLVIEYPESITKKLYRPKYGVLTNTENPFPMVDTPEYYEIPVSFEERF